MSSAPRQLMMSEVRLMRDLRAAGNEIGEIAEALGLYRSTVSKYVRDVQPDRSVLARSQVARGRLETKALRYSAFVERASAFVPVFGSAA